VDDHINRLLDLDTHREVALALLALGQAVEDPPASPSDLTPLGLETVPLSRREVHYPLMRRMHEASSLAHAAEVARWQAAAWDKPVAAPDAGAVEFLPPPDEQVPRDGLEQVVRRRGSTRRFRRESITRAQLAVLLDRSLRGIPADFSSPNGDALNDIYLIVNDVEGVPPGAYYYDPSSRRLQCLQQGDFRDQAAFLALDQDLPGEAAVAVFFLADLDWCLGRLGNRGYRAVQLEAGILGGRMYLAAYAQRLGATGLTFYDDEVVRFFSPHAAGKSAIFLVAVGRGARAPNLVPVRSLEGGT
jgi:SagB-type dehydrogenase family enzyme